MSDVIEKVLAARLTPEATRDGMARAVPTLSDGGAHVDIEPEHLEAVIEGLAQIERGEFVEGKAADLVEAAFYRHRP